MAKSITPNKQGEYIFTGNLFEKVAQKKELGLVFSRITNLTPKTRQKDHKSRCMYELNDRQYVQYGDGKKLVLIPLY